MKSLVETLIAGDDRTIRELLESGADPNIKNELGQTVLIEACRRGKLEIVRLLLESGASPNLANSNGTTPLMFAKTHAFASGSINLMNLLISYGAKIDQKDKYGKTALDYSIERSILVTEYLEGKTRN